MSPINEERQQKVRQKERNAHGLDDSELAVAYKDGPWYDQYIEKQKESDDVR